MVRLILEEKESNPIKQTKRGKKMAANKEKTCPLCLELLDLEDINFYPCKCGYQVCRFCWHRIRETENGLCPQCRRQYSEHPVTFKPLTQEQMTQLKNEKKMKEMQKKKEIMESRKQLSNVRIVQKNLVYVHGLPQEVETDEELSRKVQQIFKEFGAVTKCVINTKTNYAGSQTPRASAYVTYQKMEDALRAYKKLPSLRIEGHEIKTSLGTTKYCSNFLKNVHCPKQDCMYLHEMADEELCFTKEQIQSGQHINVGSILYDRMMAQSIQRSNQNHQTKEPVLEVNVESESVNSEKVNLKEESSESDLSEPSHSPQQSRFQHIFTNSETQNSIYGSGFENRFGVSLNSQTPDEGLRNSVPMREDLNSMTMTTKSLLSEPSVNNSIVSPSELQIFQHFNVDIQPGIGSQSNHIHKSFSSSDIGILNSKNSAKFSSLPSPFSSNGTSSSLSEKVEDLKLDEELDFDPCQLSLDALHKMTSEERVSSQKFPPVRNIFNSTLKQQVSYNSCNFGLQQLKNLQQQQNFMPRLRNPPPPGFGANAFSSSQQQQQPLASPSFEPTRNATSSRMSPVVMSNFNSIARPNIPLARYQALCNNSVANGFTPQQLRTVQPAQTFHDFPSRSAPTSQHMPSQRLENLPIFPQHFASQEQNLSPSYVNMNQQPQTTQWMQSYENFQSPTVSKFTVRPASPQNFPVTQQLRPEEMQRLHYTRLNLSNLSPFTDNSQYGFSANQNQIKGVNTFP